MNAVIAILTGLIAGAGHVFTGPDHLSAVAPLVVQHRRSGWQLGTLWGFGHSAGVWGLAVLFALLGDALPVELLSGWSERLVGFVLIAIGVWAIRRTVDARVHTHEHEHDGERHVHVHVHVDGVHVDGADRESHPVPADPNLLHDHDHDASHDHSHSAFGIGLLHGLAGTAHLVALVPTLMLPSWTTRFGYVLGFGLGAILGMTLFASVVAGMARLSGSRGTLLYHRMACATGASSIAIGVWWIFQTF